MNRNARGQFVTAQQAAANKRAEAVAYVLEEAVAEAVRLLRAAQYPQVGRRRAELTMLNAANTAELLLSRGGAS